jgi:hypothetical protein
MRGAFPREGAALKVTYLALRNLEKWNAVQGWKEALNRFALVWEARFPHQCGQDTDMDGVDRHADLEVPADKVQLRMVVVQSGGAVTAATVYFP